MRFEYVDMVISARCLRAMWYLTLDGREWGGQLRPAIDRDNKCKLSCEDVKLIEGTGPEEHADGALYSGNGSAARVAITPFYEEIFQKSPMCGRDSRFINMIFHTHPLHMMGTIWAPSPPSLGDFVAHCVLGNYRNSRQNHGQLNAMVIMSFEGMYVYNILPWRFAQEVVRLNADVLAVRQRRQLTESEAGLAALGHVPAEVAEATKKRLFNELRPLSEHGRAQSSAFIRANSNAASLSGAPHFGDSRWECATRDTCGVANLNFPMARQLLGRPDLVQLLQHDSVFLHHLRDHGFTYDFFPAPFIHDISVPVPSRLAI
jgi:hypothetical protein